MRVEQIGESRFTVSHAHRYAIVRLAGTRTRIGARVEEVDLLGQPFLRCHTFADDLVGLVHDVAPRAIATITWCTEDEARRWDGSPALGLEQVVDEQWLSELENLNDGGGVF